MVLFFVAMFSISFLIVFTLRSRCKSLVRINHGAFTMHLSILFWKRWVIFIFFHLCFNIWLYINYLFSIDNLDFLPNSQFRFFEFNCGPIILILTCVVPRYFAVFAYDICTPSINIEIPEVDLLVKSTCIDLELFNVIHHFLVHSKIEISAFLTYIF